MSQSIRICRSWGLTVTWVVAFLVLAAGAAWAAQWAWRSEGWRDFVGWPLAIVLALGALVSAFGVFTASGKAACPSCGEPLSAFDTSSGGPGVVLCERCKGYALILDSHLEPAAPDHVHPKAVFTTALPPAVQWAGCVACGAPATRALEHELREGRLGKNLAASAVGVGLFAVAGVGFVQTGGGKVWHVPVPYCNEHAAGVELATQAGSPLIRFRSHAAFRAFCAANGTEPLAPT